MLNFFLTVSIPQQLAHIISVICGSVLMYHFFGHSMTYLLAQGVVAYLSLMLTSQMLKRNSGWMCFASCISFLLIW